MTKPFVVFDFDGTIIDSITPAYRLYNELAVSHGLRQLDLAEFEALKQLSLPEMLQRLGISKFKLPWLVYKGRKLMQRELSQMQACDGMVDVLNKLAQWGVPIGVLTSNSKSNVQRFFAQTNLEAPVFVDTCSLLEKKSRKLKKRMRQFKDYKLVYVGDQPRDIEAAQQADCRMVAVDWGFNSRESLERCQPDSIVSDARALLQALEN